MGITTYVRDILYLPFYGSRIFIVNLLLLLFGIVAFFQLKGQKRIFKQAYQDFLSKPRLVVFILSTLVFLYVSILTNIFNSEQEYFFILQMFQFVIGFIYLYLIVIRDGIKSFLKSFSIALWLLLIFQLILHITGYLFDISGEITSNRNGMAYTALFSYILHRAYGEGSGRKELLLVILFALLNQTNGVVILLVVYYLNYLCYTTILRLRIVRFFYPGIIFLVIIFGSYFGIYLLLFYTGISENELIALESNRYYVEDNFASLISRLGSVPFTIESWIQSGSIFGLGAAAMAKLLYWGYPVHNYFVSLMAISGLMGVLFSFLFISLIYKISKINLMLGVSTLFYLFATNDLSLFVVLCVIPLIINRSNLPQKLND